MYRKCGRKRNDDGGAYDSHRIDENEREDRDGQVMVKLLCVRLSELENQENSNALRTGGGEKRLITTTRTERRVT